MTRSTLPRPLSRRALPAALAMLLAGAVLAGCGDKGDSDAGPDPQETTDGTTLAAQWPLTGLPIKGKTPKHRVMVVKIDNTTSSQPQIGLGSADMVVEELVEGGITRLATLFYSKVPDEVGPVRSARASDIGVVKPTQGVLVASGAAPRTYNRLRSAGVTYFEEGGPGYYRSSSRHSPYNLFVQLPDLASSVKAGKSVPPAYLPWGSESDFAGAQRAREINARFSTATTTVFRYDPKSKKYLNVNTHASAEDQFRADSVLVLRVREGDAGYLDPAGSHVPETLFFGKGSAVLFHGGKLVRGTWAKNGREGELRLSTKAGDLTVPAGHVWIELLPQDSDGGNLSFTKK